ncbi:hypothetical protein V8F20_002589 [Naviculisporaceae sp. PSN 640]
MSPPLPVPSKAALRALRGLILGTSCTLALITEDRRRRIDYALKILENGERVKGAKNYRAGGEQLASVLAMEDHDALSLDPGIFRLYPRPTARGLLGEAEFSSEPFRETETAQLTRTRTQTPAKQRENGPSRSDWGTSTDTSSQFSPFTAPVRISAKIQPVSASRRRTGIDAKWRAVEKYKFPRNDKIVAMANDACRTKNPSEVVGAVQTVLLAYQAGVAPKKQGAHGVAEWVAACALLCRTCQELGELEDATKILTSVLSQTILTEEAYFAFDPLSLINLLLKQVSMEDREFSTGIMDTCITLFLPNFTEKPQGDNRQVFEVGKAMLENEFQLDRLGSASKIYNRCLVSGTECNWEFTEWYINNLLKSGGYKHVIRTFTTRYVHMTPTPASIDRVGSVVVASVEAAYGNNSSIVLRSLIKLAKSANCKLRSEWVMRLLTACWKSDGTFESVESLYDHIVKAGLDDIVFNAGGLCRVMVELALEAGNVMAADYYIAQGSAMDPHFAQNPRLMGILARFDAKVGNWEGVRRCFAEMDANIGKLATQEAVEEANKARSDAFVPIVKIYAAEHPIRETEQFLKLYTQELNVPLASYMVPLVAKQYSALRDFKSLAKWLLYCASAAPKVDAAFGNAILASCRHSHMPFTELRILFNKLRELDPRLVDEVTERVMVDAAVSDCRHGGRMAWRRISSLRILPHKRALQGRCATEEEVRLAMKQLMIGGRPAQAISTYKRALHNGMPLSELTLRLAVRAQLLFARHGRSEETCFRQAWDLIVSAQARGHDVDLAANFLVAKQLRTACARKMDGDSVFRAIQAAAERCQEKGIRIHDQVLNQAGLACLQARNPQSALVFARQAAGLVPGRQPCYNPTNFRVFMLAYAALLQVEGLGDTVDRVLGSQCCFREDRIVRETLEHARRVIVTGTRAENLTSGRGLVALEIVKAAIGKVVEARRRLREQRGLFESEVLGIMKRAAEDEYGYGVGEFDFGDDGGLLDLDLGEVGYQTRIAGEESEGEDMLLEGSDAESLEPSEEGSDDGVESLFGRYYPEKGGENPWPRNNNVAGESMEKPAVTSNKPLIRRHYVGKEGNISSQNKGDGMMKKVAPSPSKPLIRRVLYTDTRGHAVREIAASS